MHKGLGAKAQARGHKRRAKTIARKQNKLNNLIYVSKLMFKYGRELNLKTNPKAGERYLKDYLNA